MPGVFETTSLKEGNGLLPLVGVPWEVDKSESLESGDDSKSLSIGGASVLHGNIKTKEGVSRHSIPRNQQHSQY